MDPITELALDRAHAAISIARGRGRVDADREDLERIVRALLLPDAMHDDTSRRDRERASSLTTDSGIASLYASVIHTTPHASILDALIALGAIPLPTGGNVAMVASALAAGATSEGEAIPVSTMTFADTSAALPVEATAIVSVSDRLFRDPRVQVVVTREVLNGLAHSVNTHVLEALSDVEVVPGIGVVEEDLRIGLAAAPHASGYVVVASPSDVALLALSPANVTREAGITGGRLADGLLLVPVLDHVGITIIAANRTGFLDLGVELAPSREGTLAMGNGDGTLSLFQANMTALRATREFSIIQGAPIVTVVPAGDSNGS